MLMPMETARGNQMIISSNECSTAAPATANQESRNLGSAPTDQSKCQQPRKGYTTVPAGGSETGRHAPGDPAQIGGEARPSGVAVEGRSAGESKMIIVASRASSLDDSSLDQSLVNRKPMSVEATISSIQSSRQAIQRDLGATGSVLHDPLIARMREFVEGTSLAPANVRKESQPESSSDSLNNQAESNSKATSIDSAPQRRAKHNQRSHRHQHHHHQCSRQHHYHHHHRHHHHHQHQHRQSVSSTAGSTGGQASEAPGQKLGNRCPAASSEGDQFEPNADGSSRKLVNERSTTSSSNSSQQNQQHYQEQAKAKSASDLLGATKNLPTNQSTANQNMGPGRERPSRHCLHHHHHHHHHQRHQAQAPEQGGLDQGDGPALASKAHHHHQHQHHHHHHRSHKKRLLADYDQSQRMSVEDQTCPPKANENRSAESRELSKSDEARTSLQEITNLSNVGPAAANQRQPQASSSSSNFCPYHGDQLASQAVPTGSGQSTSARSLTLRLHHHHHHHHRLHHHQHGGATADPEQQEKSGEPHEAGQMIGQHHGHRHHHHHHHHHHLKQKRRQKNKSSSQTNVTEQEPPGSSRDQEEKQKAGNLAQPVGKNDSDSDNKMLLDKNDSSDEQAEIGPGDGQTDHKSNDDVVDMEMSPNGADRLRLREGEPDGSDLQANLNGRKQEENSKPDAAANTGKKQGEFDADNYECKSGNEDSQLRGNANGRDIAYAATSSSSNQAKLSGQKQDSDNHDQASNESRSGANCSNESKDLKRDKSITDCPSNTVKADSSGWQHERQQQQQQQQHQSMTPKQVVESVFVHPQDRRCKLCWCCCCPCSGLSNNATNSASGHSTSSTSNNNNRNINAIKSEVNKTSAITVNSNQVVITNASDNNQCPTIEFSNIDEIRAWGESFERLMKSPDGRRVFQEFLRCEYSEENILFWSACEDLKMEKDSKRIESKARDIYEDYISILSAKEVSLDSRVRDVINNNIKNPKSNIFDEAQLQIYTLMHRDSYPRFINSAMYKRLTQQQ